jgi:hypothetical protein
VRAGLNAAQSLHARTDRGLAPHNLLER